MKWPIKKILFPLIIIVSFFITFIFLITFILRPREAAPLEIKIDAAKIIGKLTDPFHAGMWITSFAPIKLQYITQKFFDENKPGQIQLMLPLGGTLSFEDFKKTFKDNFAPGTYGYLVIEKAKESGARIVVGFWPYSMPEWLSSRAGDTRPYTDIAPFPIEGSSPPKCYQQKCTQWSEITCYTDKCLADAQLEMQKNGYVVGWAALADFSLRYLRDTLGATNLGYYEGHENNKDWLGPEEGFFKMYLYAASAAKTVDSRIAVGGAGPWAWDAKRMPCDSNHYLEAGLEICRNISNWAMSGEHCSKGTYEKVMEDKTCDPMNKNFIQYAKEKKAPIDFLNFHMFGQPSLKKWFNTIAETIKQWLIDSDFSPNTPLYPADWARWSGDYPVDYIDTEENAAYVARTLILMSQTEMPWWHSHDFEVFGQGEEKIIEERGKDTQFIGDWPIFTRDQIIKPVYNAFRVISIFAGKLETEAPDQLQASLPDDDYVAAAASKVGKTRRVLIANFIPSGAMAEDYVKRAARECQIQGADPISCADVKIKEIENYSKNPRTIRLTIANLEARNYTIKKYLIGKDYSNSCRYNKKMESPVSNTPCGINGEIDRKVALAKQEVKSREDLRQAIDKINNQTGVGLEVVEEKQYVIPGAGTGGTYNETLSLSPNSVLLIELAVTR